MKLNTRKIDKPVVIVSTPDEARAIERTQPHQDIVEYQSADQELAIIPPSSAWGWFPALSLIAACSLLMISLGYTLNRRGEEWGASLFWVGLVVLFAPIAARLLSAEASRRERLALIGLLGVSIYLVKILHSPVNFTFHDEFIHWRTAIDILRTGHLYEPNPIIPVSPLYPGLQLVTTALMTQTGIAIYGAGNLLMGLARLMLVLSLFLFFEKLTGSQRMAGLGALLYMGNPTFLFFSAQYAYESLSLPLAGLALFVAARRQQEHGLTRLGLNVTLILTLLTIVITHHLTAYAVVGFLLLWTLVAYLSNLMARLRYKGYTPRLPGWNFVSTRLGLKKWFPASSSGPVSGEVLELQPGPGGAALLVLVASVAWLVYVATFTIGYLAPVLRDAVVEVVRLIAGEASGRQLFKGSVGQVAPFWEQVMGYGSVGLLILALPFGILHIWRNQRRNALALTLAVMGIAYPATLGLRFTSAGWEVSNRTSEFVFVAVALLGAYGLAWIWMSGRRKSWEWSTAFVVCVTVIFMGGVMVGWPPFARIPGPYLVSADTRSIEWEGIAAADWSRDGLPKGYRMAADRINNLLMLSQGQQRIVMNVGDGVNVGTIFMARELGPIEVDRLKKGHIRYLVVDKRLTTALPYIGIYFEAGEPDTGVHKTPIDPVALAKFDKLPYVRRLYDSGNIVIYDVGEISGVR